MIQVVVGKNDRIVATHSVSEAVDLEAYAGAKQKGEKLELVTLPDDAIVSSAEIVDNLPTGNVSRTLVEDWRSKVVIE
jgi:hypothetical protein